MSAASVVDLVNLLKKKGEGGGGALRTRRLVI